MTTRHDYLQTQRSRGRVGKSCNDRTCWASTWTTKAQSESYADTTTAFICAYVSSSSSWLCNNYRSVKWQPVVHDCRAVCLSVCLSVGWKLTCNVSTKRMSSLFHELNSLPRLLLATLVVGCTMLRTTHLKKRGMKQFSHNGWPRNTISISEGQCQSIITVRGFEIWGWFSGC